MCRRIGNVHSGERLLRKCRARVSVSRRCHDCLAFCLAQRLGIVMERTGPMMTQCLMFPKEDASCAACWWRVHIAYEVGWAHWPVPARCPAFENRPDGPPSPVRPPQRPISGRTGKCARPTKRQSRSVIAYVAHVAPRPRFRPPDIIRSQSCQHGCVAGGRNASRGATSPTGDSRPFGTIVPSGRENATESCCLLATCDVGFLTP